VNCKCDGKVWCIDVGMSYGVLYSRPEVKYYFEREIFFENRIH